MAALLVGPACGGNSGAGQDAATASNHRLVIQDPPGPSIGLAFGANTTLRVRYETESGQPIVGGVVSFSATDSANTGGSSLSALDATTDSDGVAEVVLTAGAEQVDFQINVSADNAPSVSFYIGVSNTGFTRIAATPKHLGWRSNDVFNSIQLRMYRATDMRCAELDPDATPASPFQPLSLDAFDDEIAFENIIAYMPYTLVVWALGPDNTTRLAIGCVDIASSAVPPQRVELEVVVRDRLPMWPDAVELNSELDMTAANAALAERSTERLWSVLDCPAGPGQLLLDCALDAAAPDGSADCVPTASTALTDAVNAKRGAADGNGCRPAQLGGGEDSLDKALTGAVIAGGSFPTGASLATLTQARRDVVAQLRIASELQLGGGIARHRLVSATLTTSGDEHDVDVAASDRPIIEQDQVAYAINANRQVGLGDHGFTLRWGSICRDGFEALGLAPASLEGKAGQLATELSASAADSGSATTGCDAVSTIVCTAIGQAATCLTSACGQGVTAANTTLDAWWRLRDGDAIDLTWSGMAPVRDEDYDLVIDRVGTDPGEGGPGIWLARIRLADGTDVDVSGTFLSTNNVP